jgi:hypothetical protein
LPRFNPPPSWPVPQVGWTPPPGWQPDAAWPSPPAGWQLWVEDSAHVDVDRAGSKRARTLRRVGIVFAVLVVLAVVADVSKVARNAQSNKSFASSYHPSASAKAKYEADTIAALGPNFMSHIANSTAWSSALEGFGSGACQARSESVAYPKYQSEFDQDGSPLLAAGLTVPQVDALARATWDVSRKDLCPKG